MLWTKKSTQMGVLQSKTSPQILLSPNDSLYSASFIKLFYNQFNTAVNFSTGFGFFNIITNNSIVKSILKR